MPRWYAQARLLLALARGVPLPTAQVDTMPGGWVLLGTAAAWNGDLVTARRAQARLAALDSLHRRQLGNGLLLLQATMAGAERRWGAAADLLREPARAGELDGFALDRPSTVLLRGAEARASLAAGDSASAPVAGPWRAVRPNAVAGSPLKEVSMIRPLLVASLLLTGCRSAPEVTVTTTTTSTSFARDSVGPVGPP